MMAKSEELLQGRHPTIIYIHGECWVDAKRKYCGVEHDLIAQAFGARSLDYVTRIGPCNHV